MSKTTPEDQLYKQVNEMLPSYFDKRGVDEIVAFIHQRDIERDIESRIESLQWALNDYNMPDTDTKKNLEGFIADLEERFATITAQQSKEKYKS